MVISANSQPRIKSLDVIRGIAILGILFMNAFAQQALPHFALYSPDWNGQGTSIDTAIYVFQSIFFDGRFMSLFSLLFGVGLVIQTQSWQRKNQSPSKWISRRLLWLAVFGAIHVTFVWSGDILLVYAMTGLVFFRAARWQARTQLIVGIVLMLIAASLFAMLTSQAVFAPETMTGPYLGETLPISEAALAALRETNTGAYFSEQLPIRLGVYYNTAISGLPVFMCHVGGMMLIGMSLYQRGFFSTNKGIVSSSIIGIIGLLIALSIVNYRMTVGYNAESGIVMQLLNMSISVMISVFYAKLIVVLIGRGSKVLQPFAAVGRMALTLYLSQSFLMVLVFQWLAPSLFGTLDRASLMLIVVALTTVQVIFANWWLKHNAMGPLEALWRTLSFGRRAVAKQ